jgi:hypothetical protein
VFGWLLINWGDGDPSHVSLVTGKASLGLFKSGGRFIEMERNCTSLLKAQNHDGITRASFHDENKSQGQPRFKAW